MQWRKVTLVGVGLLGGSIGLALRERGLAGSVHGYVRRPVAVDECLRMGVADTAGLDLQEAVREADLVVLCTPIFQMRNLAEGFLPVLQQGALVTDVGSVKGSVVRDLEPLVRRRGACFVGSHPMAGSERMGMKEARPDLFVGATCVVTPTASVSPDQVERVEGFWASLGGRPLRLLPDLHDELVSRCSHLPHVLASQLAHSVLDPGLPPEQARLCANGFRDTTRIASGSPEMWRDICLANREHLRRVLQEYMGNLRLFEALLESGQAEDLERFFAECKRRRDQWRESGACSSPE